VAEKRMMKKWYKVVARYDRVIARAKPMEIKNRKPKG
jgi:hypothetical protein